MICLDTNYLINALVAGSAESDALIHWHEGGELLCVPSVVWYEFVCGPVTPEECGLVRAFLRGGILPFGEAEAAESARLYNAVGRPRRLRVDAMIAGSAVVAGTPLATANASDFKIFKSHGLQLL